MSGSSGDVIANDEQFQTCLKGIMTQLGSSGIAKNYNSISEALEDLDMWDFVYNQARVTAQLHAFSARDNKIINKLTSAGAYVRLNINED